MTGASPSVAQPRRPIPGENAETARLSEMVIALLGQVTVLAERLDTVERLLDDTATLPRDRIETYTPDAAAQAERDAKRRTVIAHVLHPLRVAAGQQAASHSLGAGDTA